MKKKFHETDSELNELVIFIFDEFDDDFFVRLNLEHLHNQTHKRSRFTAAAKGTTDMVEFHSFVDQSLRRKTKALLLPVGILVNLRTDNFLHQVLRIRSPYALRRGIRPVSHY